MKQKLEFSLTLKTEASENEKLFRTKMFRADAVNGKDHLRITQHTHTHTHTYIYIKFFSY
jgi:hypothetical protein